MIARRIAAVVAAALALACGSTPVGPARPGEATVRRKCGGCHRVPTPERARAEAALAALRGHAGRVTLTADEQSQVEQYLLGVD